MIGWLWAEGVIAEVILFVFSARLISRVSLAHLLIIAGFLTVLRWLLNAVSTDLYLLILTQALHGASFGLTFLATVHFIRESMPSELQASAQGFYVAIGLSPLSGMISLISGVAL